MARRSDHSREELSELALDAARRIVERDGIRALTARNLAGAIGYSPGTLYNLFGNLDSVVIHLNGGTLDRLRAALEAVPSVGDPEADVCGLADAYIAFLATHPNLWRAVFEHHLPQDVSLPDWYMEKIAALLRRVEAALEPLFPGNDDTRRAEAARVLWAGMHGLCTLASDGKLELVTESPVGMLARALVRHVLAGIRASG